MSPSLFARPRVYAHRGGAALRPENTLAAFDHGLSLGADGLELDVHLSRDGVVVVHHDTTLERTTSGRGRLAERTAEELAQLDAAHWFRAGPDASAFPYRGQGHGVPTLRTVLARYPDIPIIVELKVDGRELAARIIEDVRAAGALERVSLGSFYGGALRAARELEPRIHTGAARTETRWALYRSWVGLPPAKPAYREFQVPERSGATTIVSRRFVDCAHRAGLAVHVWTVNDPDDIRRLVRCGVDGIITDRPDVAVQTVSTLSIAD